MRKKEIREITGRKFESVSDLEFLGLDHNKIEHLYVDVFSDLFNLQHLNLEGNQLMSLHPDIFVGLPKLERLDLGINGDLQIPTDRHFITSHSLKVLNIAFCNMISVSVETFANLSALETLDLSFNYLSSIDINILRSLPQLSALPLYVNPLQCDCQLKELWQWCQDHNVHVGDPECDSQSEGKRNWRWVFKELQCVQDNISNKDEYKQKHNKHTDYENENEYKQYQNIMENVVTALGLFLSIFGTTGNVIILIIITSNKDMRTIPNMYILNLAISDMIYLTCELIANSVGFNPDFQCAFVLFGFRMSVGLSTYSVAVLSIQRYRVTVNPFHVRLSSQRTWRVVVATIIGVWIVSALFAFPSVLSKILCFSPSSGKKKLGYNKRVVVFELFVSCVYPLCVIVFTYIMMARHLVKSSFPISEESQNPKLNTRKIAAKVVVGLTAVFLSAMCLFTSALPFIFGGYFLCLIMLVILIC